MSSEKYGPPTVYGSFAGPVKVTTKSSSGQTSTKSYGQKLSVTRPSGDGGSVTINVKGGVVYRDSDGNVTKRTQISSDQAQNIIQSEGQQIEQDVQTINQLRQQSRPQVAPQLQRPSTESQVIANQSFWDRAGQSVGRTWESAKRRIIPGYSDESDFAQSRVNYLARQEQKKLQYGAQMYADVRGKQAQFELQEKRDTAQSNINQLAQDLQIQINRGALSLSTAKEILNKRIDSEKQGLQVDYSQAGQRLEQDFGEFEKTYLAEKTREGESRIQSQIAKETFGLGIGEHGISLDLFALKKSKPIRSAFEKLNQRYDQAQKLIDTGPFQKLAQQKQKTFPMELAVKSMAFSEKYILPKAQNFIGVGAGMVRRPVTTGVVGGLSFIVGAGSTYLYPKLALASAEGSKIASATLGLSKASTIALGTLFVGSSALRISTAPTKKEALMRGGETISFATASLVGGGAGSKVGSKMFEFGLSKYPTKVTSTVKQKQIGKDQFIVETVGKATRGKGGKYEFPFKTKEAISIGQDKFVRTTQLDSWFLGRQMPQVKTTLVGREQPSIAGVLHGPASYVTGTIQKGVWSFPKKVSYTIYPSGEVKGLVGKTFFSSSVTTPKKTGDLLTFKMTEMIAPRKRLGFKELFSSKKGQLTITRPGTEIDRETIFGQFIGTPKPTPSIINVPSITRAIPSIMPEAGLITITAPMPKTLLPFLGGIGSRGRLKKVSITQPQYTSKSINIPGLLTVNVPKTDIEPTTGTAPRIKVIDVPQPIPPSITEIFSINYTSPIIVGGDIGGGYFPSFRGPRYIRKGKRYYSSSLWAEFLPRVSLKTAKKLTRQGFSGLEVRPRIKFSQPKPFRFRTQKTRKKKKMKRRFPF